MFEKIKDFFSQIKLSNFNLKHGLSKKKIVHEEGGKIYKTWLFILPVLCGLALGRLASILLGMGLGYFTSNAGIIDSTIANSNDRSAATENSRGLDGFIAAKYDPFGT